MRNDSELDGVTLLGDTRVKYPDQYAPEVLETFVNKHPGNDYLVTFTCPLLLYDYLRIILPFSYFYLYIKVSFINRSRYTVDNCSDSTVAGDIAGCAKRVHRNVESYHQGNSLLVKTEN